MTPVRSLWLLCLVMCFAGLPLWAEQTLSTRPDASRPENPSAIPDGTTFLIRLEDSSARFRLDYTRFSTAAATRP